MVPSVETEGTGLEPMWSWCNSGVNACGSCSSNGCSSGVNACGSSSDSCSSSVTVVVVVIGVVLNG